MSTSYYIENSGLSEDSQYDRVARVSCSPPEMTTLDLVLAFACSVMILTLALWQMTPLESDALWVAPLVAVAAVLGRSNMV